MLITMGTGPGALGAESVCWELATAEEVGQAQVLLVGMEAPGARAVVDRVIPMEEALDGILLADPVRARVA